MKAVLALMALLGTMSTEASAMELSTVKYDGTVLQYRYATGGGCEKHVPVVSVPKIEIDQRQGYKIAKLQLSIEDKTESGREDRCRAIVYVDGRETLEFLIQKTLKAEGIDTEQEPVRVLVQLPALDVMM